MTPRQEIEQAATSAGWEVKHLQRDTRVMYLRYFSDAGAYARMWVTFRGDAIVDVVAVSYRNGATYTTPLHPSLSVIVQYLGRKGS